MGFQQQKGGMCTISSTAVDNLVHNLCRVLGCGNTNANYRFFEYINEYSAIFKGSRDDVTLSTRVIHTVNNQGFDFQEDRRAFSSMISGMCTGLPTISSTAVDNYVHSLWLSGRTPRKG